jgi:CBS domain-containing protein
MNAVKVKAIMTPHVECVPPDTSVRDAAEKMKNMDIGALLVCDNDRLVGIVTDRDIAVRAAAEGRDALGTPLQVVLTPKVTYCYDDQQISEAADLMQQKQIRRLAVLNRQERLVGIVSLGDLALRQDDWLLAAATLDSVSSCTS